MSRTPIVIAALLAACGDPEPVAECASLAEVCHEAGEAGSAEAEACHEFGHDAANTAEACTAKLAECAEACGADTDG
jgi:hypothetical protein